MPLIIRLSIFLYRRIVYCYPASLRDSYQNEMAEVFEQQVARAWAAHGLLGVLRVWMDVALESFQIVLLHQADIAAIPVTALVVASTLLYGFCAFVIGPLGTPPYCH